MTKKEREEMGDLLNNRGWELENKEEPDMEGAVFWYEKAAKLGNTTAMVNLGNVCEKREDWENAYRWYLEAAYAGDRKGMFNVANMYYWGEYVDQDYLIIEGRWLSAIYRKLFTHSAYPYFLEEKYFSSSGK